MNSAIAGNLLVDKMRQMCNEIVECIRGKKFSVLASID